MAHITRNDWLAVGLKTLALEGITGLTIDVLMQKQKVTKGSFYHHFKNYEDFKNALLAFWEQQYTARIVAFSEEAQDGGQVFARFLSVLASESPSVEIAVRSWAFQDEQVRGYVKRIDNLRIATAKRWFQWAGKDEVQAESLSRLFNALLIGCYSVFPPMTGELLRQTIRVFLLLAGIQA